MSPSPADQASATRTFEDLRGVPRAEIVVFTKSEFHGDAVWMNGPRHALMDAATAELRDAGRVTSAEGIAAD